MLTGPQSCNPHGWIPQFPSNILLTDRMLAPQWAGFSGKRSQPPGTFTLGNPELAASEKLLWVPGRVPLGAAEAPHSWCFLFPSVAWSSVIPLRYWLSSNWPLELGLLFFFSDSPVQKVLALFCGWNIYKCLVQVFSGWWESVTFEHCIRHQRAWLSCLPSIWPCENVSSSDLKYGGNTVLAHAVFVMINEVMCV